MMNVKEMIEMANGKCVELETMVEDLRTNTELSANTIRTQTFQKKREWHTMLIIKALCIALDREGIEEFTCADAIKDWFESLTTLTATRKAKYEVVVNEGDSVMELLQKYTMVHNTWEKIQKAAEKQGLKIVDGVFKK